MIRLVARLPYSDTAVHPWDRYNSRSHAEGCSSRSEAPAASCRYGYHAEHRARPPAEQVEHPGMACRMVAQGIDDAVEGAPFPANHSAVRIGNRSGRPADRPGLPDDAFDIVVAGQIRQSSALHRASGDARAAAGKPRRDAGARAGARAGCALARRSWGPDGRAVPREVARRLPASGAPSRPN